MTDEQRQRIWEIENSCDGRTELAERIVGLEDKLAIYENDHQIALRTYGSWKRLKAEVPKLREENAELRDELAKARDPQRIGGQADPSSFVYAIEQLREFRWQHATNDEDAIPYINNVAAAHERENAKLREERDMYRDLVDCMVHPDVTDQLAAENAKLRELVRRYVEYTSQDRCEGCVCKSRCNDGDVEECWQLTEIRGLARELGIEVDG